MIVELYAGFRRISSTESEHRQLDMLTEHRLRLSSRHTDPHVKSKIDHANLDSQTFSARRQNRQAQRGRAICLSKHVEPVSGAVFTARSPPRCGSPKRAVAADEADAPKAFALGLSLTALHGTKPDADTRGKGGRKICTRSETRNRE